MRRYSQPASDRIDELVEAFLETSLKGGGSVKTWEPMKVGVVGRVTEVVLNRNKQSGWGSWTLPSWSFPSWRPN